MINSTKNKKPCWTTNIRNIEKPRIKIKISENQYQKIEPKNHIKTALLQARDWGFFIVSVRWVSYSIDMTDLASQCYIIAIGASTYPLNWSYLMIHINTRIIFTACWLLEPHGSSKGVLMVSNSLTLESWKVRSLRLELEPLTNYGPFFSF